MPASTGIVAGHGKGMAMNRDPIDLEKIDRATLALLYLTLHAPGRAWKGHDWGTLDRLHEKGMIFDPVNQAKSVVFTEQGLREAQRLFNEMFARGD